MGPENRKPSREIGTAASPLSSSSSSSSSSSESSNGENGEVLHVVEGYYIAKIHWYRCVRRGVLRSYKEEREMSYLSMNAVIRTDGAVKMTKPPGGKRKGELDLSSEEQTRIFNAAC